MKTCEICDANLPAVREDYICEECRRRRIVDRRDLRPRIFPTEHPAVFVKR